MDRCQRVYSRTVATLAARLPLQQFTASFRHDRIMDKLRCAVHGCHWEICLSWTGSLLLRDPRESADSIQQLTHVDTSLQCPILCSQLRIMTPDHGRVTWNCGGQPQGGLAMPAQVADGPSAVFVPTYAGSSVHEQSNINCEDAVIRAITVLCPSTTTVLGMVCTAAAVLQVALIDAALDLSNV